MESDFKYACHIVYTMVTSQPCTNITTRSGRGFECVVGGEVDFTPVTAAAVPDTSRACRALKKKAQHLHPFGLHLI